MLSQQCQDLISRMFDAIVDFKNGVIDYEDARRKVGTLERQFEKLRGTSYHRMMGYQTIAEFIYQKWG